MPLDVEPHIVTIDCLCCSFMHRALHWREGAWRSKHVDKHVTPIRCFACVLRNSCTSNLSCSVEATFPHTQPSQHHFGRCGAPSIIARDLPAITRLAVSTNETSCGVPALTGITFTRNNAATSSTSAEMLTAKVSQ
jgi:hypothetical protein